LSSASISYRLCIISLLMCTVILGAVCASGIANEPQATSGAQQDKKKGATPVDKGQDNKPRPPGGKDASEKAKGQEAAPTIKYTVAEAIVEYALLAYGGRTMLNQVRANTEEDGTIRLATDQGDAAGSYKIRATRKEKSWQDLIRTDLEVTPPEPPGRTGTARPIKYVIAFNGGSVWSAQSGQYVTPRPEVETAFKAQLTHDYTTLLRFREDGSKVDLVGPETVAGIDTKIVELTTPAGEKTKFWISSKTFRILHSEYELNLFPDQKPVKFRISFYYTPPKIFQNTLCPTRRVMIQDGKFAQEITINTAVYSAKHDPEIYQHLQADQQ